MVELEPLHLSLQLGNAILASKLNHLLLLLELSGHLQRALQSLLSFELPLEHLLLPVQEMPFNLELQILDEGVFVV